MGELADWRHAEREASRRGMASWYGHGAQLPRAFIFFKKYGFDSFFFLLPLLPLLLLILLLLLLLLLLLFRCAAAARLGALQYRRAKGRRRRVGRVGCRCGGGACHDHDRVGAHAVTAERLRNVASFRRLPRSKEKKNDWTLALF